MQQNVGTVDRWLRVAVGAGLVLASVRGLERKRAAPAVLLALGALVLESALTRVCPLNALLGVDTRGVDPRRVLPRWPPPPNGALGARRKNSHLPSAERGDG